MTPSFSPLRWGLTPSSSAISKVLSVRGYDDDGGRAGDVFGDGTACDASSSGTRAHRGSCQRASGQTRQGHLAEQGTWCLGGQGGGGAGARQYRCDRPHHRCGLGPALRDRERPDVDRTGDAPVAPPPRGVISAIYPPVAAPMATTRRRRLSGPVGRPHLGRFGLGRGSGRTSATSRQV